MITTDDFDALAVAAQVTVQESHGLAEGIIAEWEKRPTPPSNRPVEVAHLLAFLVPGVAGLVSRWRPIFKKRRSELRVSGVFCHRTPMARDKLGNMCELGDLLIVHDDLSSRGTSRRAVLLQTKMWGAGQSKQVDPTQLGLYRDWPQFELVGRGTGTSRFTSGFRTFPTGPSNTFSRYALISAESFARRPNVLFTQPDMLAPPPLDMRLLYPWTTIDPRGLISTAGGEDLGHVIASMLFETVPLRGQPVSKMSLPFPPFGGSLDMDVTVQELLDVTGQKVIRAKKSANPLNAWNGVGRGVSIDTVQFVQGGTGGGSFPATGFGALLAGEAGGRSERPMIGMDPDESEGISVLLIETRGIRRDEV